MLLIRNRAYARAGLVGNPSDGYGGKTISLIVRNLRAQVVLYEWEDVELIWSQEDQSRFDSVADLVRDVRLHGYYGGIRLVKATIKTFVDYCGSQGYPVHDRNFSIRYESDIPRQVGLGGSSAIIVATLRCLMEFYSVSIPLELQPSLALAVETDELGISAGLQDRVIQVYEGLVTMDFAPERMHEIDDYACGVYERLDPSVLPPLYFAYSTEVSEPTERFHGELGTRVKQKDPVVLSALAHCADLAVRARQAIAARDSQELGRLMDENFNTRKTIYPTMPRGQLDMVERARRVGASAKFAGSGGAIVGTYRDEAMFQGLQRELAEIGCVVLRVRHS